MEEVRWYLIIIFASIVFISFNARAMFSTLEETIRHVSFQVASVITTTGFATTDFDLSPRIFTYDSGYFNVYWRLCRKYTVVESRFPDLFY